MFKDADLRLALLQVEHLIGVGDRMSEQLDYLRTLSKQQGETIIRLNTKIALLEEALRVYAPPKVCQDLGINDRNKVTGT